jgi:hypothetical protein
MYHVDALSQLRRWSLSSAADGGAGDWKEHPIGTGWGALTLVAGGSGVLFAIDPEGNLRWYRDAGVAGAGPADWSPGSGSAIGTGWNGFAGVTSGGQGVIYTVDAAGNLRWYRYLGGDGSPSWATGSGTIIGTGWNELSIVGGGSGVIYAVDSSGSLSWYRHLDPTGGTASWAADGIGQRIGAGWQGYTAIGSLGGGVLLARDAGGNLLWYRHNDPLGGTATWANGGSGLSEGAGWNAGAVAADVEGCSAASPGSPTS